MASEPCISRDVGKRTSTTSSPVILMAANSRDPNGPPRDRPHILRCTETRSCSGLLYISWVGRLLGQVAEEVALVGLGEDAGVAGHLVGVPLAGRQTTAGPRDPL